MTEIFHSAILRIEYATIWCPHHLLRQSCSLFASHYWVQKYKETYIAYKTDELQLVHIDAFAVAAADARQESTNVLGTVRRRTIFLRQEATNNLATRAVFKREKRNNIFFFSLLQSVTDTDILLLSVKFLFKYLFSYFIFHSFSYCIYAFTIHSIYSVYKYVSLMQSHTICH